MPRGEGGAHAAPVPEGGGGGLRAVVADALRLSAGTLTVLPVGAPAALTEGCAALAMCLAPLAGALIGAGAGVAAWVAVALGLPALLVGVVAVGAGAVLTRALHLDGLADTTDGLAAAPHGGDKARALEVMRRGDTGPAGVAALVLVLVGQVTAVAALVPAQAGWRLAGLLALLWAVSRAVLPVLCSRGVPAARPDGLGATVLGTVRPLAVLAVLAVAVGVGVLVAGWQGVVVVALALVAGVVVAARAARTLGGLTGDVLGAAVEAALLAALVGTAVLAT